MIWLFMAAINCYSHLLLKFVPSGDWDLAAGRLFSSRDHIGRACSTYNWRIRIYITYIQITFGFVQTLPLLFVHKFPFGLSSTVFCTVRLDHVHIGNGKRRGTGSCYLLTPRPVSERVCRRFRELLLPPVTASPGQLCLGLPSLIHRKFQRKDTKMSLL